MTRLYARLVDRTVRSCGHTVPLVLPEFTHHGVEVQLYSGGNADDARYSIACTEPVLLLIGKNGRTTIQSATATLTDARTILDVLPELLRSMQVDVPEDGAFRRLPFSCGLAGYLAYELRCDIERSTRIAADDLHLPDAWLMMPGRVDIHDAHQRTVTTLHWEWRDGTGTILPPMHGHRRAATSVRETPVAAASGHSVPDSSAGTSTAIPPASTFNREAYLQAVRRVLEHVHAGDVYQVNLSQRFSFPFGGDARHAWHQLAERNPAAYFAFIDAGDHCILSSSMEQFLRVRDGLIESRPIKGTRPRGRTAAEDAALLRSLVESGKDDAELSMIVDLVRNDLGRIALPGTVRVVEHKRTDSYANVHHLSSKVTARVRPDRHAGHILRAAFPAGSITGCPKIRAMEVIDELEPAVRHAYTGSIGYFDVRGNIELSVAIRTAIVEGGRCHVGVGGGIVRDSVPESEYEETLHKARTLFDVLCGMDAPTPPGRGSTKEHADE